MVFDEYLIKSLITRYDDFPKVGMSYIDLSKIVSSPKAFRMVVDALAQHYIDTNINRIVAIETNALPFAAALAYTLNCPLSCIRKYKRSPDKWYEERHDGINHNALYIRQDESSSTDNILLFDDVVLSGQTVRAASTLVRRSGASINEICCIVAISDGGGVQQTQSLDLNLYPLIFL